VQKHLFWLNLIFPTHTSLLIFLLLTTILCLPAKSFGQEHGGSLKNYNAVQIFNDNELVAGRNRFKLQFNQNVSFGEVVAEVDLIDRYSSGREFELLPRELYAEWFTSSFDIRVGKQSIIWGKSNGAFVNDIITPVDLREFLTQDMSDLRVGVTAVNVRRYFDNSTLQFILSPALTADLLPDSDSRWFPVQTLPSVVPIRFRGPTYDNNLSNIQLAVRYSWRPTLSLDIDLMVYHWAHPMPSYSIQPDFFSLQQLPEVTLKETYKTSPMAGYSVSWQPGDTWIFSAEGLFVNERLFTFLPVSIKRLETALKNPLEAIQVIQEFDIRNDGYLLTKPWIQQMIGIQTSFKGVTVGLQGYLEIILNYEDRILPQRLFPYVSVFGQRSFLRDRLQVFTVGRYNIYGKDFWAQLQGTYEIADGFEFTLGSNIFGGPTISPFYGHLTFRQFRDNSFIFAQTAVYF
jgi:hypothetical protein